MEELRVADEVDHRDRRIDTLRQAVQIELLVEVGGFPQPPDDVGRADPGKDPTTEPDLMVLWNVLDLTPGGRGTDWYPSITY